MIKPVCGSGFLSEASGRGRGSVSTCHELLAESIRSWSISLKFANRKQTPLSKHASAILRRLDCEMNVGIGADLIVCLRRMTLINR